MSDYQIYGVPVLVVGWATLTLVGTVYFALDRNASRKRMLWPFFVLGYVTAFLGLVLFYLGAGPEILFFIPFILLIGVMNFYKVRFCDGCGATVGLFSGGLFPQRHCHNCGSRL
jgi:hypothetical protein